MLTLRHVFKAHNKQLVKKSSRIEGIAISLNRKNISYHLFLFILPRQKPRDLDPSEDQYAPNKV